MRLSDTTPATGLNAGELWIEALAGGEPWATIKAAMMYADYDYGWNHPGALGQQATALYDQTYHTPLDWNGALQLYQIYQGMAQKGRELDFQHDAAGSESIVNDIIAMAGTESEITWLFMQHLYWTAEQRGQFAIVKPKTFATKAAPLPESDLEKLGKQILLWGAVGLGIFLFAQHEVEKI